MSLYLKYRPKTLSEIAGNQQIVMTLKGMLKNKETFPHVFLFHGMSGCGKTTLARIIASELECVENNLIEIDTAQFRGIDTVRELRKNANFTPFGGGVRVYIVDEVHKMTGDAQNALLKILEDTPARVYFILCTTDPQSLLPTVKGRCSQFQVQPLSDSEMRELLEKIVGLENDSVDDEVYNQIVQDSQGQPRNALQILEQVLNTPKKRRLAIAQQAAVEQSESIALCRALIKGDSWNKVKEILQGLKTQEPESIRRVVLGYASSVLLNSDNVRAGLILEMFNEPFYNTGFPGLVFACYSIYKS
ncbi:MAG: AAA family ATPase [Lutibacter sp.]|jgi:DNA polymerase III gamma/tau subunit